MTKGRSLCTKKPQWMKKTRDHLVGRYDPNRDEVGDLNYFTYLKDPGVERELHNTIPLATAHHP
jgi:hypothetical protein